MKEKLFLSAIALAVTGLLSAATLNVELTVSHGIYSGVGELAASKKVVFLVIDRSGSMSDKSLPGGRTPNEALLESLKLQLDALPFGTEIHVLPFSSRVHEETVYPSLDAKTRKSILNFVMGSVPNGQTLLYDAQDKALSAAAKIMTENANAEVRMLVYTDGEHLTPWNYEGEYKACFQRKAGGLGRKKFENNPSYQQERAAAKKKFEARWHDLKAMPRMAVEYEWLSSSQKPEEEMVVGTPIDTEFSSRSKEYRLKNPIVEPLQDLKCRLHLPITDDMWQEVVGKNVSLDFDVGGKRVSKVLVLKEGANVCKLDWPSLPENKPTTVCLALSRMPSGKKFILNEPKPIVMTVPAQACLAVTIESPAKEGVVPVFSTGADVTFRAKASEPDAEIKWAVGKSEVLKGNSAKWQPKSPGSVPYSVTASKAGFRSAEAKGSFEVIPTGVTLESASARHEVSRESVFRATAIGPCIRYEWTVDDKRVSGETAEIKHVFDKSGSHKVCVRAIYKAGIVAEARPIEISVDAAPFVKILSPMAYDGDAENVQLQAEKPIALLARVEGGLTTVSWQFKMKDKVSTVQTVIKDGQTAGQYVPLRGGFYDVVATGKGPAGESSDTVQVFVKSTEVQIGIESPRANQDVSTGKPFDLVAAVKGPVKNVRWKMANKSTGMSVNFGALDVSPVVDGKSTPISAKMPLELGNACVEITAEPIFDDEELSDAVAPASVIIIAVTEAAIVYTPETLKENWKRVKYGVQERLSVETTGAISEVSWFMEENGKVSPIGKGREINAPIVKPDGMTERLIDYFARGQMPDGSFKETEHLVLNWCCPCSIGRPPPVRINLSSTKVGRGETVTVCLVGDEIDEDKALAEEKTIVWYLDGKECRKGDRSFGLSFDKTQYGDHDIAVECRCRICGQPFGDDTGMNLSVPSTLSCGKVVGGAKIDVVHKKPVAKFEMDPKSGGRIANPWAVKLKSVSEGDVDYLVWKCDGQVIASNIVEVSDCVPLGRGKHKYSLEVGDDSGNVSEADPQDIKVWNFWLTLAFFVIAAVGAGLCWWYFSGNDLRFWKLEAVMDEVGNTAFDDLDFGNGRAVVFKNKWYDNNRGKSVSYWNRVAKKAVVPLHCLVVNNDAGDFETWMSGGKFGDYVLYVEKESSGGVVPSTNAGNEIRLEYVSSDGLKFKLAVDNPEHNRQHPKATCLYLKLIPKEPEDSGDLWRKIGLTAIFFALAVVLVMMFAV